MKRVAILGATGSVGRSTLRLLEHRSDAFEPVLLTAHRSTDALLELAAAFSVQHISLAGFTGRSECEAALPAGVDVHFDAEGIIAGLEASEPDLVLNAITGAAGLAASAWTLTTGKRLLLANKESLVAAGPLLRRLEREHGGKILPVDSEHAAIHQCLRGERRQDLRRIILTASGGPFRDLAQEEFADITIDQALRHPTWKMGPRITIGSATLMNKAFEVVEAHYLFDLAPDDIDVVVHRQSIVHSMVEFRDGSVLAQLGVPDMRVPILYCLGWPDRLEFDFQGFDLSRFATLTFEQVDRRRFPALDLGYRCIREGGDSGAVLNAADEVATQAFLDGKIDFVSITRTVDEVLRSHDTRQPESVDDVLMTDAWARAEATNCIAQLSR